MMSVNDLSASATTSRGGPRQWPIASSATRYPRVNDPAREDRPEAYRKAEAKNDALCRPRSRSCPSANFMSPKAPPPGTSNGPDVLGEGATVAGDLRRGRPRCVRLVSRELRRGYTLERLAIDNAWTRHLGPASDS